jgi:hypothetical protein
MRCVLSCLVLSVLALPVAAQEGLDTLVPLMELYGPGGSSPAYDVAGIRCAGLFGAQDNFGRENGTPRPARREMAHFEDNLEAAFQTRLNAGVEIVRAQTSVEADLFRVMDQYVAVFEANRRAGRDWDHRSLIRGDTAYCEILNR